MKQLIFILFFCYFTNPLIAQEKKDTTNISKDSLTTQKLSEVIVIGNPSLNYKKENKALGSIDSYLETSNSVNMIRRGAYAWEPMLNGMSTERSVLTIDGMRIFHACTDKMDPITSYVENTNLSGAQIKEGQAGAGLGNTIAGSINLTRKKSGFGKDIKLAGAAFGGFESNNKQQIYGLALHHSSEKFFADVDFTYRDAENYKAGHKSGQDSEVLYSQFTKYNLSAITGYKIDEQQDVEASIIYDKATDVGYPGLPMDVSLAEALIASVQYRHHNISELLHLWETKLYYNEITHEMDDSPRPVVPIRMDMPGWTKTGGFYSKVAGTINNHSFNVTLSGYLNNAIAEMTMYPNDVNEKEMFMLTWPDVNTLYTGINLDDNILLNPHLSLQLQAGIGMHRNEIKSELGLNSLRLFYPDLEADKTRVLKSFYSKLVYHQQDFTHQLGLGYGDRAPTVSEGYGFYLLNINDNYDYVGNPYMKNEKAWNMEFSSTYTADAFKAKAKVNYFYMMDYIVGKPREGVPSMNITANGIKVYEQLSHASILNASLGMEYDALEHWVFSADASYRYGQGAENTILPSIQPFNYIVKTRYGQDSFFGELSLSGSSKNRNSIEFGETEKSAYAIVNLALSKSFALQQQELTLKLGVENIFDRHYSTFDDWFGIPRMGRNIYTNLIYNF